MPSGRHLTAAMHKKEVPALLVHLHVGHAVPQLKLTDLIELVEFREHLWPVPAAGSCSGVDGFSEHGESAFAGGGGGRPERELDGREERQQTVGVER